MNSGPSFTYYACPSSVAGSSRLYPVSMRAVAPIQHPTVRRLNVCIKVVVRAFMMSSIPHPLLLVTTNRMLCLDMTSKAYYVQCTVYYCSVVSLMKPQTVMTYAVHRVQ